jgi:hypothetical protein
MYTSTYTLLSIDRDSGLLIIAAKKMTTNITNLARSINEDARIIQHCVSISCPEARARFPALPETKIAGLERGPLSLVSTTEELLDRKVAVPV